MSGIVGIFYRDSRPVEQHSIDGMIEALAHRGPDGLGAWVEGSTALGHLLLWTTPESLHEKQPLARGDLVLAADARIDNREELLAALDLGGRPPAQVTDSDLILAAYERWGTACPEKLVGDFAFVIWDKRKHRLLCVRDHSGVRPFYYYLSNTTFAFASEIKALLTLPGVPRALSQRKIASYLHDLYMMKVDNVTTFYRDISRLPPAHVFEITPSSAQFRRYWSLDPNYELHLSSDQEYAEALREIFTEAVRCRLRSAFPVASQLSGGLDSSSVVCVARQLLPDDQPLHTFYSASEAPECDESAYVNLVVAQGKLKHHNVPRPGLFHRFDDILRYQDEPLWIHSAADYWNICRAVQAQGARVLLDGDDGDSAVSHGFGYFGELAYTRQWDAFIAAVTSTAERRGSPKDSYMFQVYPYLTDLIQRGRWAAAAHGIDTIAGGFAMSRATVARLSLRPLIPERLRQFRRDVMRQPRPKHLLAKRLYNQFAATSTLDEPLMRTEREDHAYLLGRGAHQSIVEEVGRLAAPFSIEERHPFRDKRLLEFCLSLPPQQKLYQGWNRIVMRRAMENILPPEIRWRGDKASGLPHSAYAMLNVDRARFASTIEQPLADVEPYIDVAYLRELYQQLCSVQSYTEIALSNNNRLVTSIQKAVTFVLWLRSRSFVTV